MPSSAEPRVLLATRSRDKAREIRAILEASCAVTLVTLDEAGIAPSPAEDDIEVHETFLGNAHAKAAWFLRLSGLPTLADDSGIQVDALGGAPGVRSRRFSGAAGLDGVELDHANNERLLQELAAIDDPHRTARYTCAAVLHLPAGTSYAAVGTCSGAILRVPRGSSGFGYDPLFLDAGTGLSFGETDPAEKNRRSHRSRAFRALAANLPRSF
jgi:XTP/dITP diphosphohydrolase